MHFPKTTRQAEFVALGQRLAAVAAANADAHDKANTFPHEVFRELHAAGYLALTVPEKYGGRGANALEVALAQEQLAKGDGAVALGATMHLGHVGRLAETRSWPEPLFARLCREIVAEGALINAAASEPDLGSPSRGGQPATTATRTPGGWRLSGRKSWTSLAPALRYATVSAALVGEDGTAVEPGRGGFLVPMDAPGVRVIETWDNLGMRGTGSHDVVFEGVPLPPEALLPGDGAAPSLAQDARSWGFVTAAVYTGIAAAARDYAVEYARSRRPSGLAGASIAEYQTVQHRVAEIELLLLQSRAVLYGTAEAWFDYPEGRETIAWQLAATKYLATNNAIRVTDLALRVVGSAGLARSAPLERYFRDVRAGLGHPPMDDVALTQIGKHALGL